MGAPGPHRPRRRPTLGWRRSPEQRVAAGLARGDPETLHALYREHGPRVLGYLQAALGDRGMAEDILQEVFLEIWRKGATYDPERASVGRWIMLVARSRATDQLRRRTPEPRDPSMGSALMQSPDLDAAQAVDAVLEDWYLADLLGRLPPAEAEALRMRFQLEMSQSEIADATGTPLGTVKTRMTSALRRLRALLDAEDVTP